MYHICKQTAEKNKKHSSLRSQCWNIRDFSINFQLSCRPRKYYFSNFVMYLDPVHFYGVRTFFKNSIKFMARPKIAWKLKGGNPKIDIYVSCLFLSIFLEWICQKSWKESMNEKATFLNDESRHGFMNFLVKSKLIIDKKLACILIVYENHLKSLIFQYLDVYFQHSKYLNFCAQKLSLIFSLEIQILKNFDAKKM